MRPVTILALIPIVLGLALSAAEAKPKLAVLGLEVAGTTSTAQATAIADDLTTALRVRVKAGGPLALGPGTEVGLGAAQAGARCTGGGHKCLAAIGASLGVDRILVGSVEPVHGGYQITLRLFDVNKRKFLVALTDVRPIAELAGRLLQITAKALYGKLAKP